MLTIRRIPVPEPSPGKTWTVAPRFTQPSIPTGEATDIGMNSEIIFALAELGNLPCQIVPTPDFHEGKPELCILKERDTCPRFVGTIEVFDFPGAYGQVLSCIAQVEAVFYQGMVDGRCITFHEHFCQTCELTEQADPNLE